MNVGQPEVAALKTECEPRVIDSQQVQDRGVPVMDGDRIFHDVVAIIVGLAVSDAGLRTAAGHPHREATTVMIAAVIGRAETVATE